MPKRVSQAVKPSKEKHLVYDVFIVGAGPAGCSAALYALRADVSVAILDYDAPGGKVARTGFVENYLGFEHIDGPELAIKFMEHIRSLGVSHLFGKAYAVVKTKNGQFRITTDKDIFYAKTVIVAAGTKERQIGIPGEVEFYGRGVSYCAVCDAALTRKQPVAVVGGGNSALEEALYLSDFASQIYLIHRREGFTAQESIVKKVKEHPKITVLTNYIVKTITGQRKVNQIEIENVLDHTLTKLSVEFIFPFLGLIPISDIVKNFKVANPRGFINVNDFRETKIKGLFAAGDVVEKPLYQIATACSDGAIAGQFAAYCIKNIAFANPSEIKTIR